MIICPLHVAWADFEPEDLLPSLTQIYSPIDYTVKAHVQILPYACHVFLDCMIFCSQGTLHLHNSQISSRLQKEGVP